MDAFKNFAKVTVSTGYNAAATSIVLSTGHGAKLPAAPFNAVWWNSTDYSDPADDPNVEIVTVTAIATDTLTVTRGAESTSASTKNTAAKTYQMIAGLTAKTLNSDVMPQVLTTRGDLVAEGASAPQRLALGGFGNALFSDGTDPNWFAPQNFYRLFDDFTGVVLSTILGDCGWVPASSSGVISAATGEAGHPGVLSLSTSTSASSFPNIQRLTSALLIGGGKLVFRTAINLSALSDATNDYIVQVGFLDQANPVDGVYFEYRHSVNSGNWQGKASNNSTRTTVNGSVAAAAAWTTLEIVIAADGSTADFYVNGTNIGQATTNIPTTTGRETNFGAVIWKQAGTTARVLTVDYILVLQKLTTAR